MKNIFSATVLAVLLSACQSGKNSEPVNTPPGVHAAIVEEVLQTTQYTYLHVKEGDQEPWLALPKMQATVGETYYYSAGLPMTDFVSKELNRTFKEVLFLDNISKTPAIHEKNTASTAPEMTSSTPAVNTDPAPGVADGSSHAVVAEEILQTNQYTYIRGKEGNKELWLAASKMEPSVGTTYYFKGGLAMTDFASKELKRTFKEILFVDNISTHPTATKDNAEMTTQNSQAVSNGSAIPLERKDVNMKHGKNDITIALLLENRKTYSGKTIKIKGQVTKYTPGIMKKNWIHLQDGTDYSGKFDLTITTDQEVKVGDNITVEGLISLDKDFGFGYFYDVMMEDAKISNY